MSASKKDFQKLAYELAKVRPITQAEVSADQSLSLGLIVGDHDHAGAVEGFARAINAVVRACAQMNPAFDEDRFRIAARAGTYHVGMHGR